jgi:hypothetical protein
MTHTIHRFGSTSTFCAPAGALGLHGRIHRIEDSTDDKLPVVGKSGVPCEFEEAETHCAFRERR